MTPNPRPLTPTAYPVAFFDCVGGASGDMLLGALIDAGLDVDDLRSELGKLGIGGYRLEAHRVVRSGLAGTQVRVVLDQSPAGERSFADIERLLQSSLLPEPARSRALDIFGRLAIAEATVHGTSAENVHFHELGAVDAIVDIVGFAIGLERLGVERAYVSSLPLGRGMVETAHGKLPLPAPGTLALLAEAGAPTRPMDLEFESVTPTGAAILTSVGQFSQPAMAIERVGTGFGARELPWPNVLRVWLGHSTDDDLETGEVAVIETNLDDCTPEQASFAMERLLEAGALDVSFTPAYMKKNRPGTLLTVLAMPAQADSLARMVLRETPSLGVRFQIMRRLVCARRADTVATAFGPIGVKVKLLGRQEIVCPEYEECARVARDRGLSIAEVYAEVLRSGLRTD